MAEGFSDHLFLQNHELAVAASERSCCGEERPGEVLLPALPLPPPRRDLVAFRDDGVALGVDVAADVVVGGAGYAREAAPTFARMLDTRNHADPP